MLTTLTIDRSRWRTGRYGPHSYPDDVAGLSMLRNEKGFQCCLGFYCEQAGVPVDKLQVGSPHHLPVLYRFHVYEFIRKEDGRLRPSSICSGAITINDQQEIPDDYREALLTHHFAQHGCEIVFEGEYPDVD